MKHAEEVIERHPLPRRHPQHAAPRQDQHRRERPRADEGRPGAGDGRGQAPQQGIEQCRELDDNNTRHLLEEILEDEEEHIDWIEAQLALIEQVGVQNYLAQQIVKHDS